MAKKTRKRTTNTKSGSTNRGQQNGRGRGRRRRQVSTSLTPSGKIEFEGGENGEPLPLLPGYGLLELHPNGYGFLRSPENNYARERSDPFVPGTMIEKYQLRQGVMINGMVQQGRRQQGPRLREITLVDGMVPDDYANVNTFEELTPINPDQWLTLEIGAEPLTTRVMDLLTPLGKGQRALIVAPPPARAKLFCCGISATEYPKIIPNLH